MVNRLSYLRYSMREAVHGESIGKAVRDIMRLSSGLEYLKYVLVCTVEASASQYNYSTTVQLCTTVQL